MKGWEGRRMGDALNDDGDAPPNETDYNEPWPPHAMIWFREVKNDISNNVKRQCVKDGNQFKGIFKGR